MGLAALCGQPDLLATLFQPRFAILTRLVDALRAGHSFAVVR